MLAFTVARLWDGVLANAADPGWVKTRAGGPGAPDELPEGAGTQVWLAPSAEPAALVSGRCLKRCQELPANPAAYEVELQEGLLAACAELTGVELPRSPRPRSRRQLERRLHPRGQVGSAGASPRQRCLRRSSCRRSRLVGRPAAGSRAKGTSSRSRGGAGGLWSIMHAAAAAAPTRLSTTRTTSSTRSRPPPRTVTRSPAWTGDAGFAGAPFTRTRPALHASVAAVRVVKHRTPQSHRSTRIDSTGPWSRVERLPALRRPSDRPHGRARASHDRARAIDLCLLRLEPRPAPRVPRGCLRAGPEPVRALHPGRLRRRSRRDDGRARRHGARTRGRGRRGHPETARRRRGRSRGTVRAARRRLHARAQGAHGRALRRLRRPSRWARHARGARRGRHVVEARLAREAYRPAQRPRLLRRAPRVPRPRRRGAVPSPGAPGHRARRARRHLVGLGHGALDAAHGRPVDRRRRLGRRARGPSPGPPLTWRAGEPQPGSRRRAPRRSATAPDGAGSTGRSGVG